MSFESKIKTIEWVDNKSRMINQLLLPKKFELVDISTCKEMFYAIKDMIVRGAPAIGIAGAHGVALSAIEIAKTIQDKTLFLVELNKKANYLKSSRPTAVNLAWAIDKQMKYIDSLHEKGAKVLMSSHVLKFNSAERVLEIAFEQKRRGADVVKIVTGAETMEEQIENLRITTLLKKELGIPFLFLSGGECSIHRRLGMKLGCSMCLCVYEHYSGSTPTQPLLKIAKKVRDDMGF